MKTIFKYVIDPYSTPISMPKGAEILSVAFQRDNFCIWAKVDTDAELETRRFRAYGTGHEIKEEIGLDHKFIGTGWMDNGLVFHAFELFSL